MNRQPTEAQALILRRLASGCRLIERSTAPGYYLSAAKLLDRGQCIRAGTVRAMIRSGWLTPTNPIVTLTTAGAAEAERQKR